MSFPPPAAEPSASELSSLEDSAKAWTRAAIGEAWFRRVGAVCTVLLAVLCVATVALLIVRTAEQSTPVTAITELMLASFSIAVPAVACALPVALLVALFAVAYCPRALRHRARDVVFVLSSCPPILWALAAVLVAFPALATLGVPPLTASTQCVLTLALVVTPPLATSFVEQLRALPDELVFAGRALGGSTFSVHWRVLLPAILPAACRSVCVALVRALGEGIALYVVLGAAADPQSLAAHLVLSLLGDDPDLARAGFAAGALMLVVTSLALLSLVHAVTLGWNDRAGKLESMSST